jgi:iron complex outermembrane receptor protein
VSIQTESTSLTGVPETSNQIEVGAKSALFDGRLSLNVALFETERDHYFVTLTPSVNPVPEGKMRSRGVELDLIGAPLEGLTLSANFAYVDAVNRSASLVTVSGIATNQSALGKDLPGTPELSGSLWANYTLSSGPLAGLGFGAGVTYKGSTYVDALELLEVPDYTLLRAAISYRAEHFDVQLVVNNLTDETYYSVPTFIGALPGEPRSVQVTLRTRF